MPRGRARDDDGVRSIRARVHGGAAQFSFAVLLRWPSYVIFITPVARGRAAALRTALSTRCCSSRFHAVFLPSARRRRSWAGFHAQQVGSAAPAVPGDVSDCFASVSVASARSARRRVHLAESRWSTSGPWSRRAFGAGCRVIARAWRILGTRRAPRLWRGLTCSRVLAWAGDPIRARGRRAGRFFTCSSGFASTRLMTRFQDRFSFLRTVYAHRPIPLLATCSRADSALAVDGLSAPWALMQFSQVLNVRESRAGSDRPRGRIPNTLALQYGESDTRRECICRAAIRGHARWPPFTPIRRGTRLCARRRESL